ncbi:MAG: CtsR family transcriptional regulator [Symbiobacteriaceae bacterium]|nr:CtsR family transcriptional regulator [Symbiobacteriaceae bacterium]
MPTISDMIELHLKRLMEEAQDKHVEIIRNELASLFDCVPSQINYVLTTRFTPARGFVVESQRGSGGHVRIRRLPLEKLTTLSDYLFMDLAPELTQEQARHICERLLHERLITEREAAIMTAATRRSSIPVPVPYRDQVRSCILRAMILEIVQHMPSG